MAPKVSVLMSVYNGEAYLRQAVESILNQTFGDFEFIIVDDGSTDRSPAILAACAQQDDRIRLLQNDSNLGLIASLNKGIGFAQGKYLARQDADDISLPRRLESQLAFLEQHPEVGVLGTWMTNIDQSGRRVLWRTPTSHAMIEWSLLFGTSIVHASVMIRRDLLEGEVPFHSDTLHAEDYDLWARLSDKTRLANLPASLYLRRRHSKRVSVIYRKKQEETVKVIMRKNMERLLGEEVPAQLVARLRDAISGDVLPRPAYLAQVAYFFARLYQAYLTQEVLGSVPGKEIADDLARRLTRIGLRHVAHWHINAIRMLWQAFRLSPRSFFTICVADGFGFLTSSSKSLKARGRM